MTEFCCDTKNPKSGLIALLYNSPNFTLLLLEPITSYNHISNENYVC